MAGNVFSFSNIGAPVQPLGAKREAPQDPMALLNGISAKHQVPANVIAAMAEAKGAKSMADLDAIAGSLAGEIGAGKDIGAILRENGGDGAVQRATEYADLLDPAGAQKPKAPEGGPSVAGNAARMAGYAAVSGAGGASDYIGSSIDRATEATIGPMVRAATGRTDEITLGADAVGAWGAEKLRGFAKDIGPSQEVFDKAADAIPTGNITDPSSWKGPKDFSLEGLTYAAAQGLGSLLPVVATAIATKNPTASMAVGGAMAGGDGRQAAAGIIDGMWNDKLEDGTPRLAAESDVFRDLVAKGATPEAAYAEVRTRAMNAAGDIQAVIGGAGGGVTGALVTNGLPKALAGKTLAGNVARGVAGGALEEGTQEAAETAGARYGINAAAGTNLDIGEGTVEAAAAGALAGGPFGALGARRPEQQAADNPQPPAPAPILALPAPNNGGTIFAGGPSSPSQPNPSGDGSAGGQAAAPTSQPGVAPSPGTVAAAEPTAPMGPIQRAAAKAPDMTPQPQGPSLFPDMKPGAPVQLVDPETGEVQESAFLGEGPGFVTVRWNGEAIDITPQEFEASRTAAKQAASEEQTAPTVIAPEPAAPEAPAAPTTAGVMLQTIEDRARQGGWTNGLRKRRDEMQAIVDAARQQSQESARAEAAAQPDVSPMPVADGAGADDNAAGAQRDPVTGVQAGDAPAGRPALGSLGEGVADATSAGDGNTAVAQQQPAQAAKIEPAKPQATGQGVQAGQAAKPAPDQAPVVDAAPKPAQVADSAAPATPVAASPAADPVANAASGTGPADVGATWDAMPADQREALAKSAGWVTQKGSMNPPGRKIVARAWADQPETTRATLARAMAKADAQPATPATKPRQTPKQAAAERMGKLKAHFTPGNIVRSYGGIDRVIGFDEGKDGDWSVRVQSVKKDGDNWAPNGDVRTHRTTPTEAEFARGPVMRAPVMEGQAPQAPSPEDKAASRKASIKAQLAEAMTRPAETHTTKAGKMLKGYILPDATPGEAKDIDKYAFRKAGDVKAGWFVREDAVRSLMAEAESAPAQKALAERLNFSQNAPEDQKKAAEAERIELLERVKKEESNVSVMKARDYLTPEEEEWLTKRGYILGGKGLTLKGEDALSSAKFHMAELEKAKKVAPQAPQPAAAAAEAETALEDMTREQFIAAHRTRIYKVKGRRKSGIIPITIDVAQAKATDIRYPTGTFTNDADAIGHIYDSWPSAGSNLKKKDQDAAREIARANYEEKLARVESAYEAAGLDIDKAANRMAELMGRERTDGHRNWMAEMAVAANDRKTPDHFLRANKASKKAFGEMWGIALPATDAETKAMIASGRFAIDRLPAAEVEMESATSATTAQQPAAEAEPAQTSLQSEITAAAAEADPAPTEAQIEAGNYRKGHAVWNGLNLTIENAKGSERSGTDPDGETWSVTMPAHYGYFRMTEGADGEHIDFYMGDVPESDYVLIIDQAHSDTGKFDEHKVMLGFTSRGAALDAYRAAFSDGRGNDRIGGFMETNVATTKAWLESTKDPSFDATKPVKPMDFPFKRKTPKAEQKAPEGWRGNKALALFKRVFGEPNNGLTDMRDGMFPDVADYADWLGSLSDADLDRIAPVFRSDYNPFHAATFLGNGGIAEAEAAFAAVGVKRETAQAATAEAKKPAGGYGANNTFVTAEQAEKARALIRAKLKNQLNAGIDPDLLAAGIQIAAFHIEAGARRFASAAKAIADDLGMTTEQLRPYLRGWYNGARDTMQDSGLSVEGMDDADTVARAVGVMAQAETDLGAVREGAGTVTTQRLSSDDVARITTDAKTFQYKDNADESGVTERLQGVTDWDEVSAMGGMVFQYADGRMVVADGHQRLGLAKRLQANGVKTPWTVAVYRQVDGFTPEKVRHFAALKNIREGSGTAIDAAKVLRAAPNDPGVMNLPPKSALVRDARALAKLSDDAFGMVINEVASISYGAAVGAKVADPKAHKDVLGLLVKLKPSNQRQAEMIAEQAAAATTTEVQTSLFGDEEVAESLYLERAKVLDNALSRIRQDRATFKVLADRAGTIAEEGNVLNQEANARRVENDARVQAYLTAEANRKGPISDALTAAARKLKAEPRSLARITDEFVKAAGSAQLDGGRGRLDGATDDRAGGAAESLRPEARDTGVERDPAQDSDRGDQTLSLFGDEPAAVPAVAQPAAAPEVRTVSPDTFRNWKKSLPRTGTIRGWTVFDDTTTGGAWVLMSTDLMASPFASEADARAWASQNPEDKAGPEDRQTTYPTTLEEVAQKPRPGEGRLTHIYAEYRGARYYIGAVAGNADPAATEWRKTYPQASIYTTDRVDGTSINGQINELDAAIKDAEQPMFEPGADGLAQAVIPGAERTEDQRLKQIAEAKRREAEARMAQSKIRRGDQKRVEDDEGGLFGEPRRDLFDAPPVRAKPGKIEDFGEKIGGARKDVWAGFKEKMQEAEGLDVAAEPLSKSWPEPDYEKLIEGGIDPWTVGFIRAARDMIPRKPASSWKLKGWAEQVKTLRKFASDILNGKIEQDRLREKLASMPDLNRKIGGRIALYDAVGHSKSLKELSFGEHTYSMLGGVRFDKNKSFWEVTKEQAATAFSNFPKVLARAETREEAIEKFKAIFPTLDHGGAPKGNKGKGTKFLIYSHRGEAGPKYRIGVKIGKNYIDLRTGIADVAEARRIVNEEADQLQAQLDRMRDIPNERRDENAPRIGADHRNGADVTPQQFGDAFGFRGVEFGNWVEDSRRQQDLNNAYDALMDLASILDLPPKAMSLNGSLGLAFGARGSGGKNPAAAHFEPGKVVINLTKRSGRGSLAHEWFHALDNYFARKREQMRGNFITDNQAPASSPLNAGIRPEVIDAFSAVRRAIMATDLKARSQNIDKMRSDPYWGTGIEMHARAFESYVIAKLEDQGGANDYLANIVNGTAWSMMAELSGLGDSYPYLKPNEIETVRPKFDALFQTIETRETDRGVEMYAVDPAAEPVATLTGDELGAWTDIRDLGRKAEAWYRDNLVGSSPVTNANTGMVIQFNATGARKVGGRKGDVLYRMVPALRDILEKGVLVASESDIRNRGQFRAIHKLQASVDFGGRVYSVIATVREMSDGTFHYDLSMDRSEAKVLHGELRANLTDDPNGSTSALEGDLADINLAIFEPPIKPVDAAALRPISTEVARAMKAHGLAGKITPRLVRTLLGKTGVPIMGRYKAGGIDIRQDVADPRGVLFHEIIHALRDGALWGKPYGLFSQTEWQALVKAARADEKLMERVRVAYKDATPAQHIEEAVAEMYREWATQRAEASAFARAFNRIRTLFLAMGRALRGEGYVDAAVAMERIASGRVGGRGPQGPGGKRGAVSEMRAFHGTPHIFDRFSLNKIGTGEGAQAFGWGLYFAGRKEVAEWYRSALVKGGSVNDQRTNKIAAAISSDTDAAGPWAVPMALKMLEAFDAGGEAALDAMPVFTGFETAWAAGIAATKSVGRGRLFQVEIPEDTELLDWDAPLSKQPRIVRTRLRNILDVADDTGMTLRDTMRDKWGEPDPTGESIYKSLMMYRGINDRTASEALRAAGIPGHRYLDGGSRADGDGSRNYVIYDDSRIDVVAAEMREALSQTAAKAKGMIGSAHWKDPGEWVSNFLTDRMTASGDGKMSILSLVPGRALFSELGRNLSSAKRFLKAKDSMDALRNEWHAKAAGVMEKWYNAGAKNAEAREAMHDLMHRSTIAGVDPSKPDTWRHALQTAAERDISENGEDGAQDWALAVMEQVAAHKRAYAEVRRMYDALPPEFQKIYVEAKQTLTDLADDMDQAVMDNVQNAIRLSIKRAERAHRKEMERIRDDGLTGAERDEAIAKANEVLAKAKKQGGWAAKSKVASMRKQFESNRLKGPYFPLARFGQYFATVRDKNGEVISFARFERESQQKTHIKEMEALHPGRVTFGTLEQKGGLRGQVDPRFVADVEKLLRDTGADPDLMDAVWQRYLETLPDLSVRKSKIHRKGRIGWNRDALRAFASHTMHGSHQLARLKYGLELEDALDDAFDEAKKAANRNRAMALVNEMQRRKDWIMNPQGAAWSAAASSIAFVWYLGVSPAAALVNLSQTTVIGPAVMKARFKGASVTGILSEIAKATKDFSRGQGVSWNETWSATNAQGLTADERGALEEGYKRGTIDKTQAHDLAAVAESGVEFNPLREKWMRRIGWAFHHAERMNREVTMLAAYRLARKEGIPHDLAIEAAIDTTWKTHFSYQNSDRPRFMQGDIEKVLFTFRQYTVNLLFRLFRDAHQSLNGATKEDRAEAKTQLIGITLSMMAHAGIKGVWGYGLLMMLLGIFFPGGDDDAEKWLQDALLVEGDGLGTAAWNYAMGAVLNGAPGRVLGVDLSERIGSPNLWFRGSDRDLEGEDLLQSYVNETLGPTVGILFSVARASENLAEGEVVRGIESAVPKFVRDIIRTGRYAAEGVRTKKGDIVVEDMNPLELLMQANGFTPARVAERYDINSRLKNAEARLVDDRSKIQQAAGDGIRSGEGIPADVAKKIARWNMEYPEYPITVDTIRQSLRSRMQASERNEAGVSINPKLDRRLRDAEPPMMFN